MLLRDLEVEKYWYMPSSYSKEKRESEIRQMMYDGKHSYQLKTDGNLGTFICDFDGEKMILGRGISKVTKERTHYEDALFFFDALCHTFNKPTYLIGEVYYDGGVDKKVSSVLRCKPYKAKSIQDIDYYHDIESKIRFTPKDKRDIENNEYFNQKLRWRIFDCWYYDGKSLMETPWIERQQYVRIAAERIDSDLITSVPYYTMDENFIDSFNELLSQGEEGVVCYENSGLPSPGMRKAHKTCKLKRDVGADLDVFIYDVEQPTRIYNGKNMGEWPYWENIRTGEKVIGKYFSAYQLGESYEPVSKNYFYNWPAAIYVGVYNKNHTIVPICKVAGLTEDFKEELRDDFNKYYLCPVKIGGMALSDSNGISVRHPYLVSIREGDISADDCTLEKILS